MATGVRSASPRIVPLHKAVASNLFKTWDVPLIRVATDCPVYSSGNLFCEKPATTNTAFRC